MKQNKPVIGILPTFPLEESDNPYDNRASFVRMYIDKIEESGGIPIGIVEENLESVLPLCDGFLWPGGSKIWKSFYSVLEHALKYHKPVLGVCLGSQAIATYFNVLQDMKNHVGSTVDEVYQKQSEEDPYLGLLDDERIKNHNRTVTNEIDSIAKSRHPIVIKKDSMLYQIFGSEEMDVASMHKYHIERTSDDVLISARSLDGVIEAIEYKDPSQNILGVQFHPEIEENHKLFEWLISKTRLPYQVLVNKEHEIPDLSFDVCMYESAYPICPDGNMEKLTKQCFLEWKQYLEKQNIFMDVESAHRSRKMQEELYQEILQEQGLEHTQIFVAKPGFSEHETGLAVDICIREKKEWKIEFEISEEIYQVLHETCSSFGFILRYPKNKENITGYHYEPWHFRFVGSPYVASLIMSQDLTLEEYVCQKSPK